MLNIIFGEANGSIFNTELYFKRNKEDEWLMQPLVRDMILDVDKSEVIAPGVIKSPIFGVMSSEGLSGGVKTLILIKNEPEKLFYASHCGDNCAKWLLKMAKDKDVTINLCHIMEFPEPFEINIVNLNTVVTTRRDYILAAIDCLHGE